MRNGLILLVAVLLAWCGGCSTQGPAFRVVDASTGQPLQGVHVGRYSYRNGMMKPFTDDRQVLPMTDAAGCTRSGTLDACYDSNAFRFDRRGYSPAMVFFVPSDALSISSPWNGDVRNRKSEKAANTKTVMVSLKPLPESQRQVDTLDSLPRDQDKRWDGTWRFQTVDAETGLPISGVRVTYYRHGRSVPNNPPVASIVTGPNGLAAERIPPDASGQPSRSADVIFTKPGYRSVDCGVTEDSAFWVARTDVAAEPSDADPCSGVPARILITIPMYRLPTTGEEDGAENGT